MEDLIFLIFVIISIVISLLTYEISKLSFFCAIRASSFVTIMAFVILSLLKMQFQVDYLGFMSLVFGASFLGMCSHEKFDRRDLFISAIFFSLFYTLIKEFFPGLGGGLGFSAFLGVIVWKNGNEFIKLRLLSK